MGEAMITRWRENRLGGRGSATCQGRGTFLQKGDVAGGPDVVEAGIHGEDGFVGGVGVDGRRKMLGMRPAF